MPVVEVHRARSGSFRAAIGSLAIAALVVRLLYILVIAPAPAGVGGDAGFYNSAANLIAHGHFYYRGIFGHAYATAEHPPLYPLILSLVSLAGDTSLLGHRIVGCVLGAGSVTLIGLLGRRLGGTRAGLIAASIAAVYPPLVTADGLVMSEPLFVALVLVALLVACRLVSAPSLRLAVLLGAVIGLATLARGEGLALLALLGWPAAYGPPRRRAGESVGGPAFGRRGRSIRAVASGRAGRMLACTVATVVILAPWLTRNLVVFHRLTLATDSSTLVAGANCAQTYYGPDIGWWSLGCLARGRTRTQLLAGDASAGPGLRYANDHLGRLPLVASVRVLRTFDLFQPLRQGNHELRRRWVDIAGLVFVYPLLVLALVGLGRRGPGRAAALPRVRTLLLAPIWLAVIVSALGWGIGRFRVAADASLIVLAACALAGLCGGRRAA